MDAYIVPCRFIWNVAYVVRFRHVDFQVPTQVRATKRECVLNLRPAVCDGHYRGIRHF